jgi:hypothetical protein
MHNESLTISIYIPIPYGMPPYASLCRSCFPDFESTFGGSLADAFCILARYSSSSCMICSWNLSCCQMDFSIMFYLSFPAIVESRGGAVDNIFGDQNVANGSTGNLKLWSARECGNWTCGASSISSMTRRRPRAPSLGPFAEPSTQRLATARIAPFVNCSIT